MLPVHNLTSILTNLVLTIQKYENESCSVFAQVADNTSIVSLATTRLMEHYHVAANMLNQRRYNDILEVIFETADGIHIGFE